MLNKRILQFAISAVMAFLFVKFYLTGKEQSIEGAFGMVEVLVAAKDIPKHTLLLPGHLTTDHVPKRFLQPGAFQVKIPEETMKRINNKVTVAPVPMGTQITQSILVDPSMEGTGVAPLLPPGKRGYLLRLGNLDVARLILPGDYIDIMATFSIRQNNSNSKATYTILQNILVISVGRELKPTNAGIGGKKESVESLVLTLALAPEEAQKLALSQSESQGEITIVVRPHGENDIRAVQGVNPSNLLSSPPQNRPK
jgi:Flp pilus assembly protein CpaB